MLRGSGYGVVWDMDGTLVDTAELHFAAWEDVCRELGRPFTRADFAATFGRRNPEILAYLFGDRFTQAETQALADRKEELLPRRRRRTGVEPLPGVRALLEGLHRGRLPPGHRLQRRRGQPRAILRLTGTRDSSVPSSAWRTRSAASPTRRCSSSRPPSSACRRRAALVLEDAVAGVQAARAGGMKCIAVRTGGHHSAEALRHGGADRVVQSLEEVSPDAVLELLSEPEA